MTKFLAVVRVDEGQVRVLSDISPTDALASGGLVSPYYGAYDPNVTPDVGSNATIAFLFVRSPAGLLASFQTQWKRAERGCVFVTHGLAAVGVIGDEELASRAAAAAQERGGGYELWALRDHELSLASVTVRRPAAAIEFAAAVLSDEGLPYEAASQVRQFRANATRIGSIAAVYFPEVIPALHDLEHHVENAVEQLLEFGDSQELATVQERHQVVSGLVELNAGMAMLSSQAACGAIPLVACNSAVAEYSLLGIGQSWRALFRVYNYLNQVFADADHLGRLDQVLNGGHRVKTYTLRNNLDWDDWRQSTARISQQKVPLTAAKKRSHSVYFSSRQGFHETYTTMSAAWQAVHASATREWSLLTISHEYVHTHVRDLVAWILDGADFRKLASQWLDDEPVPVRQGLQLALLSSLRYVKIIDDQLDEITDQNDTVNINNWEMQPTSEELERLAHGKARRYAHEIFVHVLDFLYTYAGDYTKYVPAIWGSWAHVPQVSRRLHHYVLRTLCAIAAQSDIIPSHNVAFQNAKATLDATLAGLLREHSNGVVSAALEYLQSKQGTRKLQVEFAAALPLVLIAKYFFYDAAQVTSRIAQDEDEVVSDTGAKYFAVSLGDYSTTPNSPTAFLLDRHDTFPPVASQNEEFKSLWQMLLITG